MTEQIRNADAVVEAIAAAGQGRAHNLVLQPPCGARPGLCLERHIAGAVDSNDSPVALRRADMRRWQHAAFDRLLTTSGAVFDGELDLTRGRAPRLSQRLLDRHVKGVVRAGVDWQLSASHTGSSRSGARGGTYLAVAAERGEASALRIGVDVEQRRDRSKGSIAAMEKLLGWPVTSVNDAEFYRRWTAAEALFKTGLLPLASREQWFSHVAPLARIESEAGSLSGEVAIGGWRFRLWWCEFDATLTLCLVSALREQKSNQS